MSRKTLALIITLFVVTLVLLGVAIRTSKTPPVQQTSMAPTPTPVAHSVLSLSPNPASLSLNGTGSVDVMIDTGGNNVTAVQLELAYDPTVLTNVKVTNGTFFSAPLTLINNTNVKTGRISFALGITPQQQPLTGSGKVATISFSKKLGSTAADTDLTLLPKSLVTASGIANSVMKMATGAKVIVSTTQQTSPSAQVSPSAMMLHTTNTPTTSASGAVKK